MPDSSPYEAAQLLARLTVLERVVGMMVREGPPALRNLIAPIRQIDWS